VANGDFAAGVLVAEVRRRHQDDAGSPQSRSLISSPNNDRRTPGGRDGVSIALVSAAMAFLTRTDPARNIDRAGDAEPVR
jgi:hypothetical protein